MARRSDFLLSGGRLIEGVIRSVNNLLEKFRQSFFLYLLTAPSKFVSVGVYMIVFTLLVAPLPVVAAALYSITKKLDSSTTTGSHKPEATSTDVYGNALKSWRWLHAAKVVLVIHLWGVVVSLFPSLIIQLPERTPAASMYAWVSLSFFSLHILYGILGSPFSNFKACHTYREWATLKTMIAVASIGLALMSIINFATAQIGAFLMVLMCLLAHPFKLMDKSRSFRALNVTALNLVLILLGFPPATLIILKGWSEGFASVSVGDFWNWVEPLWAWNSAITLVHLLSWLLCILILLHLCWDLL